MNHFDLHMRTELFAFFPGSLGIVIMVSMDIFSFGWKMFQETYILLNLPFATAKTPGKWINCDELQRTECCALFLQGMFRHISRGGQNSKTHIWPDLPFMAVTIIWEM
jgi:hypothetical protein